MTRYITLTAREAVAVRGPTSQGHALNPIALKDGSTFILPEKVFNDPAHISKRDQLIGKSVREVVADEFQKPDEPRQI